MPHLLSRPSDRYRDHARVRRVIIGGRISDAKGCAEQMLSDFRKVYIVYLSNFCFRFLIILDFSPLWLLFNPTKAISLSIPLRLLNCSQILSFLSASSLFASGFPVAGLGMLPRIAFFITLVRQSLEK